MLLSGGEGILKRVDEYVEMCIEEMKGIIDS